MDEEKRKEYSKKYYEMHKDEIKAYHKQYRITHKAEIAKYNTEYNKNHREEVNAYSRKYKKEKRENDIEYKIKTIKYCHEYHKMHREEIHERKKKYYQENKEILNEKRIEQYRKWAKENPIKARELKAKYRANRIEYLSDAIPLNEQFENSEGHHISSTEIIYIPKELHQSVHHNFRTGEGMFEINCIAFDFLLNGEKQKNKK